MGRVPGKNLQLQLNILALLGSRPAATYGVLKALHKKFRSYQDESNRSKGLYFEGQKEN